MTEFFYYQEHSKHMTEIIRSSRMHV